MQCYFKGNYIILGVQKKRVVFLFLLFSLLGSQIVHAQILDDSTKQVYGPETTRYFFESSGVHERDTLYVLDTSLVDIQHFTMVDRYRHTLQNLGNMGTALTPVYFQAPETIGLTSGYTAYDPYFLSPETIRYYDTRSPYSKIKAVFGGNGRSLVNVDYSRNITPRWNVGGDFRRMTADRQIGATGFSNDKQVFSTAYDIYTHYITEDSTYRIMANISRLKHDVKEQGGIFPFELTGDTISGYEDFFDYEEENVWLSDAESSELRVNYHLYHQYKLTGFTGLFHRFDYQTQEVKFGNNLKTTDSLFYDQILIDTALTSDEVNFRDLTNVVGIKGDIGGLFYQLYYKRRDLNMSYKYLPAYGFETENYGGFDISYFQENLGKVGFFGEYLLGGNYKVGARLTSKWLVASIRRVRSDPSYLYTRYFGNHDEWSNNFEPMVTDELKGVINIEVGSLALRPRASISNVNRYLYFNENARPAQAGSFSQIFSPGFDFKVTFLRNLHFEASATYTAVTGNSSDNFRIPSLLANGSLYYTNFLFADKLQLRGGLQGHFRTAYYANAYDPVTMQFYLQNDFEIPQYYLVDFFVNIKISSARVFLKVINLSEMVGLTDGYFTTPYYTGQQGGIDFGISWMFYD